MESLPQNLELFDALCWASSSTTARLVLIYHNEALFFMFSEPNTLNTYFTTTDQPSSSNISHDSSTASLGSLLPPLLFGQSAALHAHYLEGWFKFFKPLGVFIWRRWFEWVQKMTFLSGVLRMIRKRWMSLTVSWCLFSLNLRYSWIPYTLPSNLYNYRGIDSVTSNFKRLFNFGTLRKGHRYEKSYTNHSI